MFRSLNIRGLIPQTVPSKVPYIENELIESSAIAFGLTETWPRQKLKAMNYIAVIDKVALLKKGVAVEVLPSMSAMTLILPQKHSSRSQMG